METIRRRLETMKDDVEEMLDYVENIPKNIIRCPWGKTDGMNCKYLFTQELICEDISKKPLLFDSWCSKRVRLAEHLVVWMKGFKDEV